MSPSGIVWSLLLLSLTLVQMGQCKTVQNTVPSIHGQERRIDNFVEFTDEGDQLAVESTLKGDKSDGKREILDKTGSSGRDCANVQKAILPIIPVIIASVIGLVGSIIIAIIVKTIISFFTQSQDSDGYGQDSGGGWSSSGSGLGFGRRKGFSLFGLENIDYPKLIKRVFTAIEKVY
ncbi:hypothetical protein Ocin01_01259 [Orchesella cincta]|uniref:Uncharacterized protein n=1 Tax=Orchesella cincta TaxID=48709 RepID=A0A1D2NKA6_ORCCI|nr:hypothetical protein Ocin01_01259 [Orchesella cincta]